MGDTSEEKSVITTASEVGLYGRILDDKEIVKIAKERYENPPLYMKLFMIRMMVPVSSPFWYEFTENSQV